MIQYLKFTGALVAFSLFLVGFYLTMESLSTTDTRVANQSAQVVGAGLNSTELNNILRGRSIYELNQQELGQVMIALQNILTQMLTNLSGISGVVGGLGSTNNTVGLPDTSTTVPGQTVNNNNDPDNSPITNGILINLNNTHKKIGLPTWQPGEEISKVYINHGDAVSIEHTHNYNLTSNMNRYRLLVSLTAGSAEQIEQNRTFHSTLESGINAAHIRLRDEINARTSEPPCAVTGRKEVRLTPGSNVATSISLCDYNTLQDYRNAAVVAAYSQMSDVPAAQLDVHVSNYQNDFVTPLSPDTFLTGQECYDINISPLYTNLYLGRDSGPDNCILAPDKKLYINIRKHPDSEGDGDVELKIYASELN